MKYIFAVLIILSLTGCALIRRAPPLTISPTLPNPVLIQGEN